MKKKTPLHLYVEYDALSVKGGDNREFDNGRYSGYSHTCVDLTVNGLSKEAKEAFAEEVKVAEEVFNSEQGYLVCVRYSTGGTFGRIEGQYKFIAIFATQQEANQLKKEIEKAYEDYQHSNKEKFYEINSSVFSPNYDDGKIYCSWHGYFDRLQYVEIFEFDIK